MVTLDQLRRGAGLASRLLSANAGALSAPLKLNWALTYWCQYKCKTCNIWRRRPTDELSTKEVLQVIDRTASPSWLDVTGGEIFLRDDIDVILAALAERWRSLYLLHFPTNGFLTKKIIGAATALSKSRIPNLVITVSIDGDEALNDSVRGIKGGFAKQIETLRELRRIDRVKAFAGMTLSRYNIDAIDRTFAAVQKGCPDLTWNDFHVNFAQLSGHYYDNVDAGVQAAPTEAVARLREYRERRNGLRPSDWLERTYLNNLETFLQSGRTPQPCHALGASCFIDPWGIVYPCISYSRPLGGLRDVDYDLAAVWSAAATRQTQREIWNGQCPQCWTACEAYQSILGNLLRWKEPATPASVTATLPIARES